MPSARLFASLPDRPAGSSPMLGAGPSAAARPNARRCALGTPALGAAPLRWRAGRNDCQRASGAAEFRGLSAPALLAEQTARPPRAVGRLGAAASAIGGRKPRPNGPRAPCPVRFAERGRQVLPSGRECPAGCQPTMLKRHRLGPRRRMAGEVLPRRRDACGHCQRDRGAAGQPGRRRPRGHGNGPEQWERRSDRWTDSGLCPALGRRAGAGGSGGDDTTQSGAKPERARSMRE